MKAIQHIAYNDDLSKSLTISDIKKPDITEDEVLVQNYASSINPLDIKVLKGKLKMVKDYTIPATMGYDVSGTIVEVGANVTDFKVGDSIYAYHEQQGAFAEFVAIHKNNLSLKPKNLSFEEAACLPLVSLTALQALDTGKLTDGDIILIHAGSGGVGSIAIQLAKARGAYIYTTTSTENVDWVKSLGADRVIDYKTEDYKKIVQNADMVFDPLGVPYTADAFQVLKNGGSVITLVGPPEKEINQNESEASETGRQIKNQKKLKSAHYHLIRVEANATQLDDITKLVQADKVKPVIDKVVTFDQTLEAILYVDKGHTKGKVIITIN